MKKILKSTLSIFLALTFILSSAAVGFNEVDFDAFDSSIKSLVSGLSVKSKAADKEIAPTPENVVKCFMDNKRVWCTGFTFDSTMYITSSDLLFIDIDHDGILELMTTNISGSGYFSTTFYYKANLKDGYVYLVNSDYPEYDGLDLYKGYKLYKNKKSNEYFYHGYNFYREGVYYNITSENFFYYKNAKITDKPLFWTENKLKSYDSNEYTTSYYNCMKGNLKISKSSYNTQRNNFFAGYKNLNLKYKEINVKDFIESSTTRQKNLLLESYKGYSHDEYILANFANPKDVYNIGEESSIQFTVKGGKSAIADFDVDKVKVTAKDDTVLKIKSIEKVSATSSTLKYKVNFVPLKKGETELTLKYGKKECDIKTIKVDQCNILKLNVSDPDDCYVIDNVFFNSNGEYSSGSIDLKVVLHNTFKDNVKPYKIENEEYKESLSIKNVRVVFELEGEGFSFSSVDKLNKTELHFKSIDFAEESIEDFPENPCLGKGVVKIFADDGSFDVGEIKNVKVKYKLYFDYANDKNVNSYDPEEEETRTERANDLVDFNVQAYKSKYVLEHIQSVALGGSYRNMIDNSYAQGMADIEDTLDYKWYQFISKDLDENLVDIFVDMDAISGYGIMLADLISVANGDDEELRKTINIYLGSEKLERADKILKTLMKFVKDEYCEEMSKTIDAADIADVIDGKVTSGPVYDLVVNTLKTNSGARALENLIYLNDAHAKYIDGCEFVTETIDGFSKAMRLSCSLEAYDNMMDYQKNVIKGIRDQAKKTGNQDLYLAANMFVDYANSSVVAKVAYNAILAAGVGGGSAVSHGVKKGVEKLVETYAENALFKKITTSASTVFLAYDCGKLLSECLCNSEDYARACWSIVAAGKLSECLRPVIMGHIYDLTTDSNLDTAYETAQGLDCALVMYKQLEIMSYDSVVEALNSRSSSYILSLFQSKQVAYKTAIGNALAGKARIAARYCHDVCLENIYADILKLEKVNPNPFDLVNEGFTTFKTICVQCPVDIIVRNTAGNEVMRIVNNSVEGFSTDVPFVIIEDEKFICLPSSDSYSVELIATDNGTMDYTICEFGENAECIRQVEYIDLPLTAGEAYTGEINNIKYTDNDEYNVTSDDTYYPETDDFVRVDYIDFSSDAPEKVYVNTTTELKIEVTPVYASQVTFNWSSSDESVATVENGNLKALKPGSVTVTCSVNGEEYISEELEIEVVECKHSFTTYETVKEATCCEYGVKSRKCTVCGIVEKADITTLSAHTPDSETVYLEPTCSENGKNVTLCKYCNDICTSVDVSDTKVNHKYESYSYDENATFLKDGTETASCVYGCGKKHTRTVSGTKLVLGKTSKITASNDVNGVVLKWEDVAYAKGYKVYRKAGSGSWSCIASSVSMNTYKDTTAKGNTTYKYKVRAFNDDVVSDKYSAEVTIKFLVTPKVTKVSNLVTGLKVQWNKVSGATKYYIYRRGANGEFEHIKTTTQTYYTDTAVKDKSSNVYWYTIKAGDGKYVSGRYEANSDTLIKAKRLSAPKISSLKNTTSGIEVKWNKIGGAKGYNVYRKTSSSGWKLIAKVTSTSYVDKSVKNSAGTIYQYTIRATYDSYISSYYDANSVNTPKIKRLLTPDVLSATSYKSGIQVKWKSVKGATGYYVYHKVGSGGWKRIATVKGGTKSSYVDKSAKKGATYTYTIKAYSGSYTSGYESGVKCKDKY